MKKIVVGSKSGDIKSIAPPPPQQYLPEPAQPIRYQRGILFRIAGIVAEDIRSIFGRDRKSLENKARYEEFMEMVTRK